MELNYIRIVFILALRSFPIVFCVPLSKGRPWANKFEIFLLRSTFFELGLELCSLRTADAFPAVASLPPKNSVCEPERQNDFFEGGQSDQWTEYSSSDSSRPRAQSATQPFLVSSRNAPPHKWGGALRDDSKNGCVADYLAR